MIVPTKLKPPPPDHAARSIHHLVAVELRHDIPDWRKHLDGPTTAVGAFAPSISERGLPAGWRKRSAFMESSVFSWCFYCPSVFHDDRPTNIG